MENPYTRIEKIDNIKTICFGKNGVMFNLFDLGRLGIEDKDKILVYKNAVGEVIREFIKNDQNCLTLQQDLLKIGKLVFNNNEKYLIYEEKVKIIMKKFN